MATTQESQRKDLPDNSVLAVIVRVLYTIRGSFTAFIFAIGTLTLVLGVLLQTGVMAGMLAIWGVSMMLFAGLVRLVFRLLGYAT